MGSGATGSLGLPKSHLHDTESTNSDSDFGLMDPSFSTKTGAVTVKLFISGPTGGGKKSLLVGCLPGAISWTHMSVWLIHRWKLASPSHCAAPEPHLWWPGWMSPCVIATVDSSVGPHRGCNTEKECIGLIRSALLLLRCDEWTRRQTTVICVDKWSFSPVLLTPPAHQFTLPCNLCSVNRGAIHTYVTNRA